MDVAAPGQGFRRSLMFSLRSIFSRALHRLACFWAAIKSFFSISQKRNSAQEAFHPEDLDIDDKGPLEFSLEEFAARTVFPERPTDDFVRKSFEKTDIENGGSTMRDKKSFAVLEAIKRADTSSFDEAAEIHRNGIYFGSASVVIEGLDVLPFRDEKDLIFEDSSDDSDASLRLYSSMANLSPSSRSSRDLTEEHATVNDSNAGDMVVSSIQSDSGDSASFYGDTTDEFSSYRLRDTSTSTSSTLPDWTQADDSSWKTEVAQGLNAFRECKADHDDILALFPDDKSSDTRRMSQGSQLKEIHDWRKDLGPRSEPNSPSPEADYKIATAFQFP